MMVGGAIGFIGGMLTCAMISYTPYLLPGCIGAMLGGYGYYKFDQSIPYNKPPVLLILASSPSPSSYSSSSQVASPVPHLHHPHHHHHSSASSSSLLSLLVLALVASFPL